MIDLWSDEDDLEALSKAKAKEISPSPELSAGEERIATQEIKDGADVNIVTRSLSNKRRAYIACKKDLRNIPEFNHLYGLGVQEQDGLYYFSVPLRPVNAFLLRHVMRGLKVDISPENGAYLAEQANQAPMPRGTIDNGGKRIQFTLPAAEPYKAIMRKLDAYPAKDGNGGIWTASLSKAMDVPMLCEMGLKLLPHIELDESLIKLNSEEIPGFDGTLESLKKISIGELNVVKADAQSYKNRKKSDKSLQEKLESFGLTTLYDLMLHLPRRYIDKTNPQDIRDLVKDETATVVGKIIEVSNMPRNMGVKFVVEDGSGRSIEATFWRQQWLTSKFFVGSEVIITGKFGMWNRTPQLNGTSIEHSEEAVLLPIMPIYNQSVAKGITTGFLVSAARELFARLGEINLPEYLQKEGRIDYYEAYKEMHLPSTLEHHKKVIDSLAYYELVNMQLIIQDSRLNSVEKPGISMAEGSSSLQAKAIASLPFQLTDGQASAVEEMNKKLLKDSPSATLLNAEVGSGKTIVSQLACLRAVEAGYQAVLLGPTEVLARQLYDTFIKLVDNLNESGENIKIEFLGGTMKAAEKRRILKEIKSGEVQIIVGTHALLSAGTEYNNLGLICVDEQQKFGAEMRSKLLSSRGDGRVPDLLMQSATPIPRSTAQVFYGDLDMILLKDKPKGRLPIDTEWVVEDPKEILEQLVSPVWTDVIMEAEKGNQTFVITPLVEESDKIDAASATHTQKSLSKGALNGLRVGIVHGAMKSDEQRQVMGDFRAKKYDVLVASTIVEVGVDIPDATRVVVLSADRLGASSLHQIRGRAGRNSKPSKCYLVSMGRTEGSAHRLQSLVDNENGFDVAKSDLALRGEGQIFGSTQSGVSEMIFASLSKHSKWIPYAQREALEILASPWREEALAKAKGDMKMQDSFK